ncbi:MAG TPA: bifunctional YncE family protein/alkaline phosphatase family protein [Verrucomicrobiae bacterium]|nr:bifunctional YncE family protein/alkaline phosphatase family protein [Verrucomicrobiae bacterium]
MTVIRGGLAFIATLFVITASGQEVGQVGPGTNGTYLVPTTQLIHPAGDTLTFSGRAIDLALAMDGKNLFVKYDRGVLMVDPQTWKIRQEVVVSEGGSIHGIAVRRDGTRVYVTGSYNALWDGDVWPSGSLTFTRKATLLGKGGSGYSNPCGLALSPDETTALVCLSLKNSLALVDLGSDKLIREIPVGIAPYDVVVSPDGQRAYVSNWGGRPPGVTDRTADSYGTPVRVDKRGAALSGTVSVIDLKQNRELREIATGLHPSGLALSGDGRTLYVANANSDTISAIDTETLKVSESIPVRPDPALPFGSQPNALVLSPDGRTLFVANGGNNAIAVVALRGGSRTNSIVTGFIPAGWFPGAVATDGKRLYVANVKGYGSRVNEGNGKRWSVGWSLGSVNRVGIPTEEQLANYTAAALADARVPEALRAWERTETGKKPVPVPEHISEPSVFDHVVYILKENRTYDQFLGDLPKANGDANLCVFGREVTPNHHHIAEEFVALDNFYCNGVLSQDGHRWATEGNVMAGMEKAMLGFRRGDAFGVDPLYFSSSGFIWDDVLLHGLSFRNYGEMGKGGSTTARIGPQRNTTKDMLENPDAYQLVYEPNSPVDVLKNYSCPKYPGFELNIPDVLRARVFLQELKEAERNGRWPNFMFVHLPNDHTGGNPTPRAQVADNDLALGRIVEGISHSKFWAKTCIFVMEDDPQSGFDHVDGHRSMCFVVSPYTKRHAVVSQFYNQTGVLHTMELILGIPPMNQMDAMGPVMRECFTNAPDFSAYTALPNQIPLDEMQRPIAELHGKELYWAKKLAAMRFDEPDLNNDDLLNRIIWHSVKGVDAPYPVAFAGPHGKGLKALNLKHAPVEDDDDD